MATIAETISTTATGGTPNLVFTAGQCANIVKGNLLVAVMAGFSNEAGLRAFTSPQGWTYLISTARSAIDTSNPGGGHFALQFRIADGNEASSGVTFSHDDPAGWAGSGHILRITGHSTEDPMCLDASFRDAAEALLITHWPSQAVGRADDAASPVAPSILAGRFTIYAEEFIILRVMFGFSNAGALTTATPPAGFTENGDVNTLNSICEVSSFNPVYTGVIPAATITNNGTDPGGDNGDPALAAITVPILSQFPAPTFNPGGGTPYMTPDTPYKFYKSQLALQERLRLVSLR